jgi:hypothetical protein
VVFVKFHDIDEVFLLGDQVVILGEGAASRRSAHPPRSSRRLPTSSAATFIGADRGKRAETSEVRLNGDILVDADGRAAGVLVGASGLVGAPGPVGAPGSIGNLQAAVTWLPQQRRDLIGQLIVAHLLIA